MSTTEDHMEEGKVFVGNLSFSTRKDGLADYFSRVGKVAKASVIRRGHLRSAGYGFVTFEDPEDAEKATQELNKTELDGREITVELAKPKPDEPRRRRRSSTQHQAKPTVASKTRIFVANLPYATTDDELSALFETFTIESASIARLRNGRSKGYGFVEVSSEKEQANIIENFKDIKVGDRDVSVKVALMPVKGDEGKDEDNKNDA
ncbi:hypothetical protein DM01DRAFT_1297285 [Hesseltinella vesiculosa]|uniref:RRM domain-containing protein n=1 Tax=Hesseltinella vesiculosa TaxID=101127 RepID=A0A1X2GX48_9FUNG|nr:hypothetical protein DM01DRAFT_1297285 [Hesseltinella vesiculosa]